MIYIKRNPAAIVVEFRDADGSWAQLIHNLKRKVVPQVRINWNSGRWEYTLDFGASWIDTLVEIPSDNKFAATLDADSREAPAQLNLTAENVERVINVALMNMGNAAENKNCVTPQMFGATGNGITDDTDAIQAALDSCNYVYIPNGRYVINPFKGMNLHSNQQVVLDDASTILCMPGQCFNTFGNHRMIRMSRIENTSIRGGIVIGDRLTREIAFRRIYTTTDESASRDVYIEEDAKSGELYLYYYDDEVKTYLVIGEHLEGDVAEYSPKILTQTEKPQTSYTWNADLQSLQCNTGHETWCFAVWNKDTTISVYRSKYFLGEGKKYINKNLSPARFYKNGAATYETSLKVDTPYKLILRNQNIADEVSYYFFASYEKMYNDVNCISVSGCKNITIENMDISQGRWDSIGVGEYGVSADVRIRSEDVTVRNCVMHDDGRSAMSITGCIRFRCFDCVAYNLDGDIGQVGSAIDLEPNYEAASNLDCIVENLRCYNTRQGIIINGLCYNTTVQNCTVNTIQNYGNRGDSLIRNCVADAITCKSAGTPRIDSCFLGYLLVTRAAKDIRVTNCVFDTTGESSCVIYEGLAKNSEWTDEQFHQYQDNSETRLYFTNCTFTSRPQGTGRMNIIWCENTSLLATEFHNCTFNIRNGVLNNWYSEKTVFAHCVFNIDSDGEHEISNQLFRLQGRVNAVNRAIREFVFSNNLINFNRCSLKNVLISAVADSSLISQNTARIDRGVADLNGAKYDMLMTLTSGSNPNHLIIQNVAPDFAKICDPGGSAKFSQNICSGNL